MLFLGTLIIRPEPVSAQGQGLTGRTVRIWAPTVTQKRILGTLVSADDSAITLSSHTIPGDTMDLRIESVRILEVAEGKRSNMLLGAVAGMGAGALIGLAVGQANKDNPDSPNNEFGRVALAVGVAVGFVVGTVIGVTSESEVWKRIPPDRLRADWRGGTGPLFGAALKLDW